MCSSTREPLNCEIDDGLPSSMDGRSRSGKRDPIWISMTPP